MTIMTNHADIAESVSTVEHRQISSGGIQVPVPDKGVEVRLLSAALLLTNDLRRSGLPGRRFVL
jgi:hypothetical protein